MTNLRTQKKLLRLSLALAAALLAAPSAAPGRSGDGDWVELFNGKNLDGWYTFLKGQGRDDDPSDGDSSKVFQVDDGVIHLYKDHQDGTDAPLGYFGTVASYAHYHLRFEYKWGAKRFKPRDKTKRDSGLLYHTFGDDRVWPRSVELQIQEGDTGDIFTVGATGGTVPLKPNVNSRTYLAVEAGGIPHFVGIPHGQERVVRAPMSEKEGWNVCEAIVLGNREALHIVNGKVNNRLTDLRYFDDKKGEWAPLTEGRIAFQAEFAEVLYRNIEIKPLPAPSPGANDPQRAAGSPAQNKPAAPPELLSERGVALQATEATLSGPSVRMNYDTNVAAWWRGPDDRATWRFKVDQSATVDVLLVYGVPNELAEQPLVVELDGKAVVRGKLPGTGGFAQFRQHVLGTIDLTAGEHSLSFRPSQVVRGDDLVDLQTVILAPHDPNRPRTAAAPLPEAKPQPKSIAPVDMLDHISVPEGFVIERVAGPPLVNRPISADFDERGRLYVTDNSGSNENVQLQLEKKPHRVVRLEDTDGDGQFDKSTVFADKMMLPQGAMWHDGSLYVAAPPQIWKLTDTDDDGVADQREVWFDGKTLDGCANDLHGPFLGPDGWIYWCKGAFKEQTYERPGKPPLVTQAAHIFRRRPDGGPIEHVMTGGMNNPVDVAFTAGGERVFTTTFLELPAGGKRDGLIHAVYGGVYGRKNGVLEGHPRTGELMPVLVHLGAAAPCGLTRLETDQLGDGFRDNLLACQFNMHKVSRHLLAPLGATFIAQDQDFVTSEHIDFHPTDVLEDADGSVLVVDTGGWYMLCCPTSQLHKPEVLGAIYRVRRSGRNKIADPRGMAIDWPALGADQLAQRLGDSRPAVRRCAQGLLVAKGHEAVPSLAKAAQAASPREKRLQAIWTLTRIDDPAARTAVRAALTRPGEQARQAALHSVALWRDAEAVEQLVGLLQDKSLHNRRAAAEAIGRIGAKECIDDLLAAAADYRGRFLDHSLTYALIEIGDHQRTVAGLTAESPHTRRAALLALENLSGGGLQPVLVIGLLDSNDSVMADTAWWITQRHPEWADAMEGFFRKNILDPQLAPDRLAPLTRHLARFSESPKIQDLMAAGLCNPRVARRNKLAILEAVATSRQNAMPETWSEALARLLATGDGEIIEKAVSSVHAFAESAPTPRIAAGLKKAAASESLPIEVRLRALAAGAGGLALNDDLLRLLLDELSAQRPVRNRSLAIDVLLEANLNDEQLVLLAATLQQTASMDLMRLLGAFATSTSTVVGEELLSALDECPAAAALDAAAVRKVLNLYGPSINGRARPLLAKIEAAGKQKAAQLEAILALLEGGDVRRGQQVFNGTKAACSACHAVGYLGGKIGPDLTSIGRIRDERTLLESILFPSATFVQNYEPVVILTTSGKTYAGTIKDETPDEVVLSLDAEKTVRIVRDEIEERRPGAVSIMPTGLDKQLTPQQLADLIVFLRNAK